MRSAVLSVLRIDRSELRASALPTMYIPRGKIMGESLETTVQRSVSTSNIMIVVNYSTLLQASDTGIPNCRYLLEPLTPSSLSFLLFSQDEMHQIARTFAAKNGLDVLLGSQDIALILTTCVVVCVINDTNQTIPFGEELDDLGSLAS